MFTISTFFFIIISFFILSASIQPPSIDISPLFTHSRQDLFSRIPDDYRNCLDEIDRALREHGLFIAINTITESLKVSAISNANELFSINSKIKAEYKIDKDKNETFMRGFIGFGSESGLAKYFEPKEGFGYGYNQNNNTFAPMRNMLEAENRWPREFNASFIATMDSIFHLSTNIARTISQALSKRLESEFPVFAEDLTSDGAKISLMRIFKYFPVSVSDITENNVIASIGSSPHTDWGFLTVIAQDNVAGLQYDYNGEWIDVTPIPGSVVINCGDFFSLLTKGRYKSPIHQVLSPPTGHRYSYVYFFYPNFDTLFHFNKLMTGDTGYYVDSINTGAYEFNTLLSGIQESQELDDSNKIEESFGSYIIKKWYGVYRA